MLWAIAIIFALVWVIGIITPYTLGGAIHVLLAVAIILLLIGTFKAGMRSRRRNPPALSPAGAAGTASAAKNPSKGAAAPTERGSA